MRVTCFSVSTLLRRAIVLLVTSTALFVVCLIGGELVRSAEAAPSVAYVNVGVATLWTNPTSPRPVDAPAISNPSSIPLWQRNMTQDQKWGLVGLTQTQALYGQKVYVLEDRGDWVKVAVSGQPTPQNSLGYPGWVPKRQLTYSTALAAYQNKPFAQVESKSAWVNSNRQFNGTALVGLSYGTRLPVLESHPDAVLLALPNGNEGWIRAGDVRTYASTSAIPKPTGDAIVSSASAFLGLPYLWAGTSGFGFDCSGLPYAVYRAHGITIPRDTVTQQELAHPTYGRPVSYSNLQKGDLVYFAYNGGAGAIHHVGMYIGGGKMIHSPNPSSSVRIDDIRASGWINEYAGAIRYLP